MADALLESLARILPADRILSEPNDLRRYQKDLVSPHQVMPRAAVVPSNKQQVIDTVRVCHELGVPFLPRGAGSSLSGGALPIADGIVIHLKELNHILRLDPTDRIAVVEPGVINLHVTRAGAEHNLYYAPDPSSQSFCTIGGNVAFNSGGVHCLRYGMTSSHVLGVQAVLADGEVIHLGGESLEGAGPDLTGLFVGSEGLFGIALEITLRLIPQVETRNTVLAAYRTLEEAGNVVSSVVASGLLPGALEIMDPLAIEVTEAVSHAGYPLDAGALVIVELEGEQAEVEQEFAGLLRIIKESGAYQTRTATDDQERDAIWKGRKAAFTAIRKVSANYIIQDGVVPRSRLGEALIAIEALSKHYDIPVANVFHAGDGNLHPLILYEAEGCTADRDRAEELAGEIIRICIDMGGSITGEHGVGLEKRPYLPDMYGADDMALMHRLRGAMDPKTIANPGKMLEITNPTPPSPVITGEAATPLIEAITAAQVQEAVRTCARIAPVGGGTKPSLAATRPGWTTLNMTGLSGILEYDPEEFTFTALAGTPVAEIAGALAEHGQYLPFDPPFAEACATIGGTVAAGLSGPGSHRYGGIRNFILGALFVDGSGTLIRGGSKVVKNAAGFDFPKLMVGSLGGLGVLLELTFKVFPSPRATTTLQVTFPSMDEAVAAVGKLATASLTLESVEVAPEANGTTLSVRLSGSESLLADKVAQVADFVGSGTILSGDEEQQFWQQSAELSWAAGCPLLIKVPIKPSLIGAVDHFAADLDLKGQYGIGGSIAWLAAKDDQADRVSRIDRALDALGLPAVVLRGTVESPLLGHQGANPFRNRVKEVLDPSDKFTAF